MRFKVYDEVFEKLPNLYFGVVVGYHINETPPAGAGGFF
ncbi:hypothetical protein ES705_05250 [subsurface metagenome]